MSARSSQSPTIVDFGAHLYPEPVFPDEVYADNPLADLLGASMYDPDVLLDRYEAAGIDAAVLSQPFYMGHEDPERTARANDALLHVVTNHEAFYGLAAVPVAAGGDAAAAELERSLDAGYNGGALETKSGGVKLADDENEPVFEVAADRDAPLLVHPKLHDTVHPDALSDRYVLNATFGREVGLATSICEAIHTGLFDRYPDLTLVFHHYGGNIASMLGRVHLQLDEGRWPGRQEHVKPYTEFKAQLDEHVSIDTSGFFGYEAPLRASADALPTSQILFGTDYPFEGRTAEELTAYTETVTTTVDAETADRIHGENALDILTNVE
jgi:predicted TIM-barrel fold metal-dependent hydrolase